MNKTATRALLARPLVFVVGAGASALVNPSLQAGSLLGWIIAIFAGTNLAVFALHQAGRGRGLTRFALPISPVISLMGWGTLATFTGGLESPFIAAIFFELALAFVSMEPRGVLWVTGSSIGVLAIVQGLYGFGKGWQLLLLEAVFVLAIGVLGAVMSARRRAGEVALRTQGQELGSRLDTLQRELEDERVVSRVGENVARLAHGLKNAVHSLRGFVGLIEPRLERGAGTDAALAGLRAAIDDLEQLARLALAEGGPSPEVVDRPSGPQEVAAVASVVARAQRELMSASPEVNWSVHAGEGGDALWVGLGDTPLLELLVILMRNAVEAMDGRGEGEIEYGKSGDSCHLTIRDEGKGFASADLAKIFQPGFTTKEKGSGFGLFLARRIVEEQGGSLEISSNSGSGAEVRVALPLVSVRESA